METLEYGNQTSSIVLIEPVFEFDVKGLENKAGLIQSLAGTDFYMIALKVGNWNHDLSPWKAPAVFGTEEFGDGAAATLEEILKLTEDRSKTYYLGGYSLAGLFALWAATQTDVFHGVAGVSPSVWFPDFTDYVKTHPMQCDAVYLSLGDKEEKTRNPVMATVGDRIRELHIFLNEQGIPNTLEWNPGNHFRDPDLRTAKGFAWLLKISMAFQAHGRYNTNSVN